jgi:phosphoserine phosphatase RsbU/P
MSAYRQTRTLDTGLAPLDDLLDSSALVRFDDGDVLIRQGDLSECAYYLTEGSVAVFAESPFERVRLATIEAPRLIGELGVLAQYPRTATIEAIGPVVARRLTGPNLVEIGTGAPDFLLSVISQLGRQLDGMNRALGLYANALSALEKREFDPRILDELAHPAPQIVTFAATFKRFAEQIVDKRRQSDELASAALIQRSFLPRPETLKGASGRLDLHADMRPARDVGGDFYDFFMLDKDRVAIAVGDVCGKGIPASLFMAVTMTTLRSAAMEEESVAATLARTNASLCRDNDANMFATLFYAVLNLSSGELEYGNCGHSAPYLLHGGTVEALTATGIPVGLFEGRSAKSRTATLAPGDFLLLYTDGVTEAEDLERLQFGTTRLEDMLPEIGNTDVGGAVRRVFTAVDAFAGRAEQADDITCMALRFN